MRLVAILLFLIPVSLFSQKAEHETFKKIMRIEKAFLDPGAVKVDTLRRSEVKSQLNFQLAASLANFLLSENRDTAIRLSGTCPNLIFLTEGTIILYWDNDLGSFQGTFIEDRDHILVRTMASCSRVYSIQEPIMTDSPPEPDSNINEDH
jgi:hypothetical protein